MEVPLFPDLCDEDNLLLSVMSCASCDQYLYLWHKGKWTSFNDFLALGDCKETRIIQVEDLFSRVCLWVLSQVCHNQQDCDEETGESSFLPYPKMEFARILIYEGNVAGFYTLKLRGSPYGSSSFETYQTNMVDTIYVRSKFRGLGLGTSLIYDCLSLYPTSGLGFSQPVSNSLIYGLRKILLSDAALRDKIWFCCYTGEEGYRENAWFAIKMIFKQM